MQIYVCMLLCITTIQQGLPGQVWENNFTLLGPFLNSDKNPLPYLTKTSKITAEYCGLIKVLYVRVEESLFSKFFTLFCFFNILSNSFAQKPHNSQFGNADDPYDFALHEKLSNLTRAPLAVGWDNRTDLGYLCFTYIHLQLHLLPAVQQSWPHNRGVMSPWQ